LCRNQRKRISLAAPVQTLDPAALAARFRSLVEQWKADTAYLSSTTALSAHAAYQAIIALGRPAVLILRDLEHEPAHWFEALRAITGEDPVPRADWGNIPAMRAAWLSWGRKHRLI
jgi:hypothetical protein